MDRLSSFGFLALVPLVGVLACGDDDPPLRFVVMTFNTGSGAPAGADNGDFGPQQSQWSDDHYGNGLAWEDAMARTSAFLAKESPDIIGFQEIFYAPECEDVPEEAKAGFICERWQPGDPTVVEEVLSDAYQIACHAGTPDECVAVHERLGRFRDCDGRFCVDALQGQRTSDPDCSRKTRVARGILELNSGEEINIVHVHANSGLSFEDDACRVLEVEQVFVDQGDGNPAARGDRNIILGDFNTDPWRMHGTYDSARRWNDFVGEGKAFGFLLDGPSDRWATYGGLFQIDQLVGDRFTARDCHTAGPYSDRDPVLPYQHFDHQPVWCEIELQK